MFSPEFLKKRLTAIQVLISPRSSLPDVNQIEQNWKAFPILRAESSWIRLLNTCKFDFCLMNPFCFEFYF